MEQVRQLVDSGLMDYEQAWKQVELEMTYHMSQPSAAKLSYVYIDEVTPFIVESEADQNEATGYEGDDSDD